MSTNSLPSGWDEVFNFPEMMNDLEEALAILADSFPAGQYPQSMTNMIRTMICRQVDGYYLLNLRVFIRKPDVCAFFFLREDFPPRRYCLSPAALASVSADELYNQLVEICAYMRDQPHNPGLQIVSETTPPTFKYSNLGESFDRALNPPAGSGLPTRLTYVGLITPGNPWPNRLFCWDIVNLP